MPYFDVFSPSRARDVRDISLTLEAANWMLALRGFLQSVGQDPDHLPGMMCDARADGSLVLTFPSSNRWFRIRPRAHAGASLQHVGDLDSEAAAPSSGEEPAPRPEIVTADRLELRPITAELTRRATEPPRAGEGTVDAEAAVVTAEAALPDTKPAFAARREEQATEPILPPRQRAPTTEPEAATEPVAAPLPAAASAPASAAPAAEAPRRSTTRSALQVEQILEEIFERSSDFFSREINVDLVVSMFLDLAMDKIPSQVGAFYVADISGHDLQYAALRSPRARKVLSSGKRVTIGEGVAGLCAQENITFCINDLSRYPDLLDDVVFLSGQASVSTLCVSIERDGRCFGAIQLVDRSADEGFDRDDVSILEAIAHHVAEILARAVD